MFNESDIKEPTESSKERLSVESLQGLVTKYRLDKQYKLRGAPADREPYNCIANTLLLKMHMASPGSAQRQRLMVTIPTQVII
jgi:hypothetical protein